MKVAQSGANWALLIDAIVLSELTFCVFLLTERRVPQPSVLRLRVLIFPSFLVQPPRATPSLHSAPITQTGATSPAPPQPQAQPPASQPVSPPEARPSTSREPNRDAPWLHFGNSRHIHQDSKLL